MTLMSEQVQNQLDLQKKRMIMALWREYKKAAQQKQMDLKEWYQSLARGVQKTKELKRHVQQLEKSLSEEISKCQNVGPQEFAGRACNILTSVKKFVEIREEMVKSLRRESTKSDLSGRLKSKISGQKAIKALMLQKSIIDKQQYVKILNKIDKMLGEIDDLELEIQKIDSDISDIYSLLEKKTDQIVSILVKQVVAVQSANKIA